MERISGDAESRYGGGGTESHMHLRSGPSDPFEDDLPAMDDAAAHVHEQYEELRGRAAEMAERARERVSAGVERAGVALEERTGVVSAIRENPLLAIGAAFSLGLVIAASTGSSNRSWVIERARRQLRAAILSGLTAAAAHELRSIFGVENGFGDIISSLIGGEDDEEEYAV